MIRKILAVVLGLGIALIVIAGLEGYSEKIYPMPATLDMNDQHAVAEYIRNMPAGAVALMLLIYALSSFVGGYIAGRIGRAPWLGIIVGILLTVAGIVNVVLVQHPLWMSILFVIVYLPFAWIGAKLATVKQ